MIYVCSDFHFGHDKDFIYAPRGFESIEEMNEGMIKLFNHVVRPDDEVYILGDLGLKVNAAAILNYTKRLNGAKKHLIIGNHDSDSRIAAYKESGLFESVEYAARVKYNKTNFYLSHYPTLVANCNEDKPLWNIHGHTHQNTVWNSEYPRCINVSPEALNCTPVSIDEIWEWTQTLKDYQITE